MRSKKGRISAVFLALVLLFSFTLVMFAGCGDPEGEGGGEGSNAAKFVTDDSLSDKLLAMYTFEESNPANGTALNAYNPYTGDAIPSANGQYALAQDSTTSTISTVNVAGLPADDDYQETTGSAFTTPSTRAFNVTTPVFLSKSLEGIYETQKDEEGNDIPVFENGVSISFWAYNYEKDKTVSSEAGGTLAIDYANIVSNGNISVTWGNISRGTSDVIYPDSDTRVGRAAYTDEWITHEDGVGSYYEARTVANSTQLGYFDARYLTESDVYDYTGWNVISGNVQDAVADSTVDVISSYCYQTWRYVTVSLTEDGVRFYMNGRLAYFYPAETYLMTSPGWITETALSTAASHYYRFIYALAGTEVYDSFFEENTNAVDDLNFAFNLFGYDAKAYVDDLIIGYALDASEAQALYENLSGVSYTAADLELTSTISDEDAAHDNALSEALQKKAEDYEGAVTEANKTDAFSYTENAREQFISGGGIDRVKKNQGYYEEIGNTSLSQWPAIGNQYYKPTVNEDGTFEMTVTALQFGSARYNGDAAVPNQWANWFGIYAMLAQETAANTYRGVASLQGSGGIDTWLINHSGMQQRVTGVTEDPGHSMAFVENSNTTGLNTGLTFQEVMRYSWLQITLEWDGQNLTVRVSYYYYYVGDSITVEGYEPETIPMNADTLYGSATMRVLATDENSTIEEVLTGSGYGLEDLCLRFGTQYGYLLVTDVEGGECTGDIIGGSTASANSIS